MKLNKWSVVGVAAVAALPVVIHQVDTASAKQGVPAQGGKPGQGGTPSQAPGPANSQPRQNQPGQNQPNQNQPGTNQPGGNQPGVLDPNNPNNTNPNAQRPGRYERPFAFQTPNAEGRFRDSSRNLQAMEARMEQSNQALLKRLGELRNQPPERQSAALADLLQEILIEQGQLQKYLVQSRTTWSGDLDDESGELNGENNRQLPGERDQTQPDGLREQRDQNQQPQNQPNNPPARSPR